MYLIPSHVQTAFFPEAQSDEEIKPFTHKLIHSHNKHSYENKLF